MGIVLKTFDETESHCFELPKALNIIDFLEGVLEAIQCLLQNAVPPFVEKVLEEQHTRARSFSCTTVSNINHFVIGSKSFLVFDCYSLWLSFCEFLSIELNNY
jgi:hypothetical protein